MPTPSALARATTAALVLALVTACTTTPKPDTLPVPDVTGERLDVAEELLQDAGFEHVWANNTTTSTWVVNWENWAVVSQPEHPGTQLDPDDEVELHVGPLDDERTLALLDADAPVRAQVEQTLAANAPAPTADPTLSPSWQAHASTFGLPDAYVIDRGIDGYGNARPSTLRRDVAEYATAVRAHDPATADTIAHTILATPAAWCSYWLPRHTPADLTAWRAQAATQASAMASDLGVPFTSHVTPQIAALMDVATKEAGARFCSDQAASPGVPTSAAPAPAARIPDEPISILDTALDHQYRSNGHSGAHFEPRIGADEIEDAYITMLALPGWDWNARSWPVVLPCADAQRFATPGAWRETAETIRRDNKISTVHSPDEIARAVADHEASVITALADVDIACR